MSLAGSSPVARRACIVGLLAAGLAGAACAQAPVATPVSTPTSAQMRESSITLHQVLERQNNHYAKFATAQGIAVNRTTLYSPSGQPSGVQELVVFFAFDGTDSHVTLAMPKSAANLYRGAQGQVPWSRIVSATLRQQGTIYDIRKGEGNTTAPQIIARPFDAKKDDYNFLTNFHPRLVGETNIPLAVFARSLKQHYVSDIQWQGRPMLRIDFVNPATPQGQLTYVVDGARGYLPVEILMKDGKGGESHSEIVIGHTPDGTWIPARHKCTIKQGGRITQVQEWHYDDFVLNRKLAPQTLSLMYFNLPLSTPLKVVDDPNAVTPAPARGAASPTPAGSGHPAVPMATPIAPPISSGPAPRVAPEPMKVPLP